VIVPFPATSENAAVVFSHYGVKADVIYIDAAHEYEPALRDFITYWDLLDDGGYIIGDDYIGWEGVTRRTTASREKDIPALPGRWRISTDCGPRHALSQLGRCRAEARKVDPLPSLDKKW
jgi:hypothetical protein